MLSNNPPIEFPTSPSPGEFFQRRQWDGSKWIPAGLVPIWELAGDAPDDGLSYGRTEGDWRVLAPFEHVLTVRLIGTYDVPVSNWTLVPWDTVDVDTQGGWDNTLRRYTPNVPGLYLFQCLTPALIAFMLQKNSEVALHAAQIAASYVDATAGATVWYHTYTTVSPMNGTTDFVNSWGHLPAAQLGTGNGGARTEFSAYRMPGWRR